jgi:hypothetical protein
LSYTYVTNVGDGVTRSFPFSFAGQDEGYLSTANIIVYIAGTPVGGYEIKPSSPNVVEFVTAPPLGAEILIRRVMPKNVPYADFSRGNPFSQDVLNKTNLQMLYLLQEIYDGFLPDGFYFRINIDMRGQRIINLGAGINPGDAVNKAQLDVEVVRNNNQDTKITALEDSITSKEVVNYISQVYIATGGETTISTLNQLPCVALYINGLFQHKISGAYGQVTGTITLAEALYPGDEVYLILGSALPVDSLYATIESLNQLQQQVTQLNSAMNARVLVIEQSYAKKGANNDITSITGLTTPLAVNQGGNGNNVGRSATATKLDVPRGLRVSLANPNAVNFDGSADVSNIGITGTLPLANGGLGATTAADGRTTLNVYSKAESDSYPSVASTVWSNITPASGWTVPAGRRASYRKVLGLVFLEINLTAGTITDATTIGTLPVGYRPPTAIRLVAYSDVAVSNRVPSITIGTDGVIQVWNLGAGATTLQVNSYIALQ